MGRIHPVITVLPNDRPAPLDMAELAALSSLPLRARCLADAAGAGFHRSRRRGASVEFADYRDYHHGDDLRRVDWRLLARTDRAHIREAYEETPLRVLLLLDGSASMNYASRRGLLTKLDYARTLLGAIALIVRRHRDACGVGLLAEDLTHYLEPSSSTGRLQSVWAMLDSPHLSAETKLSAALARAASTSKRSCLMVIASDFYEDPETIEPVLRRLRYEGHDALALHLADPEEEDFTFDQPAPFQDPESGEQIPIDPAVAAEDYRAAYARHRTKVQEIFLACGFAYLASRTDTPPLAALGAYLARRANQTR